MGKYNNLLTRFMYDKDRIVYEMTGVRLVGFLDMTEMSEWSESECKTILSKLNHDTDYNACPWCLRHSVECHNCAYGKRHSRCDRESSTYQAVFTRVPLSISQIPKIRSLVRRTKLRYWVLRLTGLSL